MESSSLRGETERREEEGGGGGTGHKVLINVRYKVHLSAEKVKHQTSTVKHFPSTHVQNAKALTPSFVCVSEIGFSSGAFICAKNTHSKPQRMTGFEPQNSSVLVAVLFSFLLIFLHRKVKSCRNSAEPSRVEPGDFHAYVR